MSQDEPTTQELKLRQLQRELEERRRAEQAYSEGGTDSHQRRADKAEYLRHKLEEREESERRVGLSDDGDDD
jgi:hypothetical protein